MSIKHGLYQACIRYANDRVRAAEQAIFDAQQASIDDTKSSAGDKYETTREMMQQEISRNQIQLLEAGKLKHALSLFTSEKSSSVIQTGSLARTSNGNFYIAVSAGQVMLENEVFYIISPASPIGKLLIGLKADDSFEFNGKTILIKEVL